MTVEELRRIAERVGNIRWCRHWLHWNYPCEEPWLMAISAIDRYGRPMEDPYREMEKSGLHLEEPGLWIVERTDGHGLPFRLPSMEG